MPTIPEIKRELQPGKKTHSFLTFPLEDKPENLIPDGYELDSYGWQFNPTIGTDRGRAVFDNSKLTGKPRQNLDVIKFI